jgi:LDH2 family malate/lactate/ureidoglycolate dehydrogenase
MTITPTVPTVDVPLRALDRFCRAATARMGFSGDDATMLSDVLLAGSLRSLPGQGQGVQRLLSYHERIKEGVIDPAATLETVTRGGAVALLDAHRAAGAVAGTRGMRLAVDIARAQGIGAVGVRDSTHFGVAAYYAELALAHDQIGLAFTNAGPEVAPWGAAKAVVGTNPWAVAVPSGHPWPVVLDMANSTSGKGMIRWHLNAGVPIPDDWGFTATGERTTDPAAAMEGPLFPLGGPKGYALAVIVDALTGVLTGSAFGLDCFGLEHQDVGHLFIAIDIAQFTPVDAFRSRMDALIAQIHSAPLAPGADRVRLPGEIEHERAQLRRRHGVPLEHERIEELRTVARELGVEELELPA